ncbi:ribonuclease H-like domain-containing protein [Cesiribacter andamanensis]|uniref:Putative 3'-5' exonuclease n=1 Tax=Cesiribacter andamanensis AMV16 TaxID=1279009 RepID=M7N6Z3_9BACT|nr:ribonuclease H-like domain-containing protein [Cesiribacter andamanensis]EMR03006.1 putative 3'-5' exonuclease [Cesiribacter andamanensis AMV16]
MTTRPFKDILFVDIETVTAASDLESLDKRLQQAWLHKVEFLDWMDEDVSPAELYHYEGGLYAEFGRIVSISVAYFHEKDEGGLELRVKSYASADNEQWLLEQFKELLNERFDQRTLRLCSHNGKEFDFPYLCRRMLVHCVPLPEVLNFAGKKPWEVPHLDTMEMWMFGNRKYTISLETLAALFHIPYTPHPEGDQINSLFFNEGEKGLDQIVQHSQQDVIATAQVYMRYRCQPLLKPEQIVVV